MVDRERGDNIKSDNSLSQTYIVARAREVLSKSENYLLKVLNGETKLPERVIAQVALELYKRRIPAVTEGSGNTNNLTVIKVIKNHLPNGSEEVMDIDTPVSKIEQMAKDKVLEAKARIKAKQEEKAVPVRAIKNYLSFEEIEKQPVISTVRKKDIDSTTKD